MNSFRNSPSISKVERRKLAAALDSWFVRFGTLQQCAPMEPGRNRTRELTIRNQASNRCATSAHSGLEFSTSLISDIARIILDCLTHRGKNVWVISSFDAKINSRLITKWEVVNFGANHFISMNSIISIKFF